MSQKLLLASVATIGLLLAGPQKASAEVIYACVNPIGNIAIVASANASCPPNVGSATWVKINWNVNAGDQAANVLYTPVLTLLGNGSVECSGVNVAAQSRMVTLAQFNDVGPVGTPVEQTLNPGGIATTTNFISTSSDFYCKFTVTDGTSSDIRGSLQVCLAASPPL